MKHIADIYINNLKIVMCGPYSTHIWHLYLPCGFAGNFPAITGRVGEIKSNHLPDYQMEE